MLWCQSLSPFGPRFVEGGLANVNATWEESRVNNLSIQAELFKGLSFGLDLYEEWRTGILMSVRLQSFVCVSGVPPGNIGETKNHGYELQVGWKDKINEEFSYNINFNTAFTDEKLSSKIAIFIFFKLENKSKKTHLSKNTALLFYIKTLE